ncbi:helix-turn-helix transcriptional regulator [Sulfitobacter porphyrae]|uniref:Helix-turn-helix transcriptional regulator n=2 Tax=Rhodobacterales TaxID=204455 RepID=A0ABW2BDX0_9RHOB
MNLRDRVALNIQELRRARGLSQEELAHRADVSRGHMGKVENAKFAASLGHCQLICTRLNAACSAPVMRSSRVRSRSKDQRHRIGRGGTMWR